MPGYWAFPGGHQEPGETLGRAALRELKEETGLEGRDATVIGMFPGQTPGYICTIFRVEAPEGEVQLSWEHDDYRWVDPEQLSERHPQENLVPIGLVTKQVLRGLVETRSEPQ
jgi:8-oxo-dGTP pyrophosphatase MutT (NUDIX family)